MRASCWLDRDVEFRDDEPVVSPAFGAAHGFCHSDVLSVLFPNDDIVDEMPVLRVGMHPRRLVVVRQTEDCVSD